MDALFQIVWFRLIYLLFLLFFAMALTVVWFIVGPSNPWFAWTVVWGTCVLVPAVPAPAVMRTVTARGRFSSVIIKKNIFRYAYAGAVGPRRD